jgi:ABC-2 type transport system ATP-binding protein
MDKVLEIMNVNKSYANGFVALKDVNLEIKKGEIFALLGPNGAGKTTLINAICGLINLTSGEIKVGGVDNIKDFRKSRQLIGLVPQELTTDAFETVLDTVSFSRGLFGLKSNPQYVEGILKKLSLYEKRNSKIFTLSGGMKRRVMIAKALSHEPKILFLDEPTAGVDVQLRESMWEQVSELKELGVTIILTTHYIEEAEKMADRIGIINKGLLTHVDKKSELIEQLGKKKLIVTLTKQMTDQEKSIFEKEDAVSINENKIIYEYSSYSTKAEVNKLFTILINNHIEFNEVQTEQSSLQDIFVNIVRQQ